MCAPAESCLCSVVACPLRLTPHMLCHFLAGTRCPVMVHAERTQQGPASLCKFVQGMASCCWATCTP